MSERGLQAVEGEGPEGEAGVVIVGELRAPPQEVAGLADHDGKGGRGVPGPNRTDRGVTGAATMVEHRGLVRWRIPAEAGEASVHIGTDATGAEAGPRELKDVVGTGVRVEGELAPEGDEAGAGADGSAPADEDPEAGPRGSDLEDVGRELSPEQGEERVEFRRPRSEVR